MDTLSHGLWGGLIAKAANRTQSKVSYGWAMWWGMFPDLIAFGIPFLWLFSTIVFTPLSLSDIAGMRNQEPPMFPGSYWFSTFAPIVYQYSHSLVLFVALFAIVFFVQRSIPWVLLGWPLHILMDIPFHTAKFYPTPFLWPLSDVKINGTPWSTPWILLGNYAALIILYLIFRYRQRPSAIPFQTPKP